MSGILSTNGLDPIRAVGASAVGDPLRKIHTSISNNLGINNAVSNPWSVLDTQYAKASDYEASQRKIRASYNTQPLGGSTSASASSTLLGS